MITLTYKNNHGEKRIINYEDNIYGLLIGEELKYLLNAGAKDLIYNKKEDETKRII